MKIYVGNLPFDATQSSLQDLFAQYGQVASVSLITDRETGQPRGFGFVDMPEQADANKAIESLNGQEFGGRRLNINEAKPRESRPSGGVYGGGGRSGGYGGGGRSGGGNRY